MRRLVNVLGVPVDDVTMSETVDRVAQLVAAGRATGRNHQVTTVNVDFVVNATRDPDLMRVLQDASLSLPDGMPIVWASRVLGTRLRERVAGADLVEKLAERAAESGYRMYLFGSAPGVAARAADILVERFPPLQIVADAGPMVESDGAMDDAHVQRIEVARPDIVCVALGNPKQEYWIGRYGHRIGAPVLIGVGGTLDLIVGEKQRAPAWMQRVGLEWVFRAGQEPRRLVKRYAIDISSFFPQVARQVWLGRRRGSGRGVVRMSNDSASMASFIGAPTIEDLDGDAASTIEVVDAADLDIPDNRVADLLVSVAAEARWRGTRLVVRSASDRVRQRLADLGVDELFVFESGVGAERTMSSEPSADVG